MKKNILIILLIFITVFSMWYASVKAGESEKATAKAQMAQQQSEELKERADTLMQEAENAASEARAAMEEAAKIIADCESSKKNREL